MRVRAGCSSACIGRRTSACACSKQWITAVDAPEISHVLGSLSVEATSSPSSPKVSDISGVTPAYVEIKRAQCHSAFSRLALRKLLSGSGHASAAPSSGQPRPISRLGRAGRPYRPWFRHSPARLRSLCCCASVPWVEISCARWVWREPRTSAPTVIDCCAVAFASANLAQPHCRCPVPSTASAATAGRGFGVALMEAWPVGRRNGLSSGSITEKEGQDDNSRLQDRALKTSSASSVRGFPPSRQRKIR